VIGSRGPYFADFHHFFSVDRDGIFETVEVPRLKKREVQTNVRWFYIFLHGYKIEKSRQMFDIVHFGL